MAMGKMTKFRPKKTVVKKAVKKEIKKQINRNLETKYTDFDQLITPDAVLSGGITYPISNLSDGTIAEGRIGRSIRAFKVEIRYRMIHSADALTAPATIRMILFRDNAQGTQLPLIVPDVLETGNLPTLQQYNWDTVSNRIEILADRRIYCDPTSAGPREKNGYLLKKKTMIMSYDGPGQSPSGKGRLHLGFVSDDSDPVSAPKIAFSTRIWFKDG